MKHLFTILLFFVGLQASNVQKESAFQEGEWFKFKMSYSGFFKAGNATLSLKETKLDGIIASNTSTDRSGLKASDAVLEAIGNGGLSGQPIKEKSTQVIKYLSDNSNKAFPIIGVGGIHSANDALDKIEAGADLVQIYTGFIYEGPSLIKRINKALLK